MGIPTVNAVSSSAELSPFDQKATFALSKVVANIRRGTPIINFPASDIGTSGALCNYRHKGESNIEWGAGSSVLGNWSTELGEIFYEALTQKGFDVAGDPKELFGREESVSSAEYLIGARIMEIKGNICQSHHWWDGRPLNEYSGETYVKVEWIIYSTITRQKILSVETDGYKFEKQPRSHGVVIIFQEAFADAAEKFASNNDVINVALRKSEAPALANSGEAFPGLTIFGVVEKNSGIKETIADTLNSVVTIRVGMGHGTGFIASLDGYIFTNAHVVGEAAEVAVRFSNGLETTGKVVRTNKQRDTAVLKVPFRTNSPLSVSRRPLRALDTVYAVGSPLRESLESTITKGVVSALREDKNTGLRFIQADVPISPGNSGGPLLDDYGNVVGMSVAKFQGGGAEGLSLFIPIDEVLSSLSVDMKQAATN